MIKDDDAYISTDIDALINYLMKNKKCSVASLSARLGVPQATVRKWLAVLEDEGYVQINRTLFNEDVEWIGPDVLEEEVEAGEGISEGVEEGMGQGVAEETPSLEEEDEIESRIKSILSKVGGSEEGVEEVREELKEKGIEEEKESIQGAKQAPLVEEKLVLPSSERKVTFEPFKISKTPEIKNLEKVKEKLTDLLAKIEEKKAEIQFLEKEKEELATKELLPAEEEFRLSYENLLQRILEKKQKLLELQTIINEMFANSEKITEAEELLKNIKHESVSLLKHNKDVVNRVKELLAMEEDVLHQDVTKMKEVVNEEVEKLNALRDMLKEIEEKEQETANALANMKVILEELGKKLRTTEEYLYTLSSAKEQVKSRLEEVEAEIKTRKEEFSKALQEMKETDEMQKALEKYLQDYEQELRTFENYLALLEAEIAEIKKEAQATALNRYMDEIALMAANYEKKLEEIDKKQSSLEEKIANAKASLAKMINESKELIRQVKVLPPKDFSHLVQKAKKKVKKVKEEIKQETTPKQNIQSTSKEEKGEKTKEKKSTTNKKKTKKTQTKTRKKRSKTKKQE